MEPDDEDKQSEEVTILGSQPFDPEKTFVAFGGAVKALPGGKLGGYLVTFGGVDLTGEYLARDTDYGEPYRLPVM